MLPSPVLAGLTVTKLGLNWSEWCVLCHSVKVTAKSKHRIGYCPEWRTEFPWLEPVCNEEDVVFGLLCSLCRRHDMANRQNQKRTWNDVPCTSVRKDKVAQHGRSDMHKAAVLAEEQRVSSEVTGGIAAGLQTQIDLHREAVRGAMQALYWLAKEEVAHTTKYESLLHLARTWGHDFLSVLNVGKNAKYTSETIIQEFLQAMADTILDEQLKKIDASPFFTIISDETTDIAVSKQLVIVGRCLLPQAKVANMFLHIVDLRDGTAETITTAINRFTDNHGELADRKMIGFGSDGAAVMTGRHTGVATRLTERRPHLVAIHCCAHRLNLALSQAGNGVRFINDKFKPLLKQLFKFYKNSAVRTAALAEIQSLLDEPRLKLVDAKDVRWLSHDRACRVLQRTLPAVLTSLEREAEEREDVIASGLSVQCRKYSFVATLYLMCRVLPAVSAFSRLLQSCELDLTQIQPGLSTTVAAVRRLSSSSEIVDEVDADLEDDGRLHHFSISTAANSRNAFLRNIQEPFVQNLLGNLEARMEGTDVLTAFTMFDPAKLPEKEEDLKDHCEEHLEALLEQFGKAPDPVVDSENTREEWQRFLLLMSDSQREKTMQDVLRLLAGSSGMKSLYPNLSKIAGIALLLPMSTADGERVFSDVGRVKTAALRSRMKDNTLDNLLRIHREGPALDNFSFEKAVALWGSKKRRRLLV